MKLLSILLIPSVAIFVSACGGGPGGPVYGGGGVVYNGPANGYGPGPNPQPGYYWNGAIYVQGQAPWYHNDPYRNQYRRNVTNVNDVDVNRTNITDRTVNNTTVNNTSVNDRTLNRTNINRKNVNKTNVNAVTKRRKVGTDEKRKVTGQPALNQ